MRQTATRPIRLATGLVATAALAIAACGSDEGGGEGGGGSTEAFCEEIQALAESEGDTTEAEDLEVLQADADVAPGDIADEMDELVDGFERLQAFDPEASSEEEMTDFLAMAGDLDEASIAVEEFALENCPDLPDDFFSTE